MGGALHPGGLVVWSLGAAWATAIFEGQAPPDGKKTSYLAALLPFVSDCFIDLI